MNNEELYKSMLAFSKAYSDALKPLNSKTMRFFSSDAVSNALKTFSIAAKLSIPKDFENIARNTIYFAFLYSVDGRV